MNNKNGRNCRTSNRLRTLSLAMALSLASVATMAEAAFKVVGYFPTWSGDVNTLPYHQMTHVNYSFILPTAQGGLTALDDPNRLRTLVSKAHAANVKVSIAIGGWNNGDDSAFRALAANASTRNTFVQNVLNFIATYNLDGVDIDWEYPDGNEVAGFRALMQQLSTELHARGKLLTAAVTTNDFPGSVDATVANAVDFLNIMVYDLNYPHSTYAAAQTGISHWVYNEGLAKDKVVLGVPFYSRQNGYLAYKDIIARYGAWAAQSDTANAGLDYNGQPTIRAKSELALMEAGGIMYWEASQDTTGDTSLMKTIWEVVGNATKGGNNGAPTSPIAIPGTLEAEHYTTFNDTTAGNTGGAYRSDNVDIEASSQNGYNIGWIAAGEWLEYRINVQQSGKYKVESLVASQSGGGQFTLAVDGQDAGRVTVSTTGGWQTWQWVNSEISLSAGEHRLRIKMDTTGFNLNALKFTRISDGTTPPPPGNYPDWQAGKNYAVGDIVRYNGKLYIVVNANPGYDPVISHWYWDEYTPTTPPPSTATSVLLQAEAYTGHYDTTAGNTGGQFRTDNVDIEATTDTGGGYNVGWIENGEWLEYSIDLAPGKYTLNARVASANGGGTYHVMIDGKQVVAPTTVENTSGWQTWITKKSSGFDIAAGKHTLRVNVGGAMNLNWLQIARDDGTVTPPPPPPPNGMLPMIRQNGARWVDSTGKQVDLRGVNLGNWLQLEFWMMNEPMSTNAGQINDQCTLENELSRRFGYNEKERLMDAFRDSWMTDRDWDNIAKLGFNTVRLPFWYNLIEDENKPYTLRADAWQYLDKAINEAAKRGMYTILDLHGAVGSQGWEHHSGCAGRNWYWNGGNGQTAGHYQDRTRWLWDMIAQRYKNNSNVAGYGLLNEPWGTTPENLANVASNLYHTVRRADPNHVIILPGHSAGIDAYGAPASRGMNNDVAFEMHFYPGFWGWREGQDPTTVHSEWLHCSPQGTGEVCAWRDKLNGLKTPFLVGEFQPWTALGRNAGEITRKTFDIYNMLGWAGTAWSYKTVSRGGHNGDGNGPWPWGLITNRTGFGTLNVSTASAAQIESWFRSFAGQALVTHPDIAYWMNYKPTVGSHIEAEHFSKHNGVRMEVTTDPSGGDFNVGWLDTGDSMTFPIEIPASGRYMLQYRVATPAAGGSVALARDNAELVATAIPATGGYQNWQTVTTAVNLNAGKQELTLRVKAGGWNLNWWSLTPQ